MEEQNFDVPAKITQVSVRQHACLSTERVTTRGKVRLTRLLKQWSLVSGNGSKNVDIREKADASDSS